AATTLRELGSELSGEAGKKEAAEARGPSIAEPDEPLTVRIEEPPPDPMRVIEEIAGPAIAAVATAGLTIVCVVFMLLERRDLRDRLIRLTGPDGLHLTTEALDDAARRVRRFLLMQLVVNASYGLPIGSGLHVI